MQTENRSMAANLRLYPWYAACFNAHFWMPVFFLYFFAEPQHVTRATTGGNLLHCRRVP